MHRQRPDDPDFQPGVFLAGISKLKFVETFKMTAKGATLLTVLMISAILFMATGIFSVDAGNHQVSSDGYGISSDFH
ncbi:hypothetical protein DUT91_03840 [Phyllobacterium salinisoli]|uniref:Uncharacterized protein n=1 Tax=Phyllobacterium salinisoli TaxID=1899321 RepID=A0A368K605_9HYPH|nr:hypothetical protein DUT91_03840 [Phyllobacterium salinisoli]